MSMRGRILVIQSPMRAKISLTIHHRVSAMHIEMAGMYATQCTQCNESRDSM